VIKRVRGLVNLRHRALAKKAWRAFGAQTLANIYWSRKRLTVQLCQKWVRSGPKARKNGPQG
jgi:hypothetical protein